MLSRRPYFTVSDSLEGERFHTLALGWLALHPLPETRPSLHASFSRCPPLLARRWAGWRCCCPSTRRLIQLVIYRHLPCCSAHCLPNDPQALGWLALLLPTHEALRGEGDWGRWAPRWLQLWQASRPRVCGLTVGVQPAQGSIDARWAGHSGHVLVPFCEHSLGVRVSCVQTAFSLCGLVGCWAALDRLLLLALALGQPSSPARLMTLFSERLPPSALFSAATGPLPLLQLARIHLFGTLLCPTE